MNRNFASPAALVVSSARLACVLCVAAALAFAPRLAAADRGAPAREVAAGEGVVRSASGQILMQAVQPRVGWKDLRVSEKTRALLRAIAATPRGTPGTIALFSGADMTARSGAAEVLASEMKLPLYRIDLSAVVSKYIGETEKNLDLLFARVEDKQWVLFFDEADALFGKRTSTQDAHDRYANQEISYLLQRLEKFQGLAILASNSRENIDPAFLRRIRHVVDFVPLKEN